jgi:hypothetical protein
MANFKLHKIVEISTNLQNVTPKFSRSKSIAKKLSLKFKKSNTNNKRLKKVNTEQNCVIENLTTDTNYSIKINDEDN